MELTVGTGANEDDAVFINKGPTGNIRVGINNTNPEFDLDVEGQIRTTRSIISDTAQIRNLDVTNEFVTKGLDFRGPNLINFEETDPTAADFGTIYYPTADNPPRQTQNNRIATTKFVYDVATADNGGRVYVSSVPGIGDDNNDGRSAAKLFVLLRRQHRLPTPSSRTLKYLSTCPSSVLVVTILKTTRSLCLSTAH